jgi:hypothetical protein
MKRTPRELLRASRPGRAAAEGSAGVIVALKPGSSAESILPRLQSLGLEVERTVGDKVVGRIAGGKLEDLRADPAVVEVETSARLRPHRRS